MGNVGSSLLATRGKERGREEKAGGKGMKAGERTKDESGCRWRGRKESHEMLDRFVGPAGESRGPRCGGSWDEESVDKARMVGRRTTGVQLGWWFAPERKREVGWVAGTPEDRKRGGLEAEGREVGGGGTRILPKRRAIPGAALNESAFLCPAMLSKCKQRPIIYHPFRKQLSALPLYLATRLKEGML